MSRFFPHAAFAEDQSLGKTILTTHVAYRGFQSGAILGLTVGAVRSLLIAAPWKKSASAASTKLPKPALGPTLIRPTGVGAIVGAGFSCVALVARMQGREAIEWQDRSWRLLANPGQVEVDDWSAIGTVAGAAASTQLKSLAGVSTWKRVGGGAGLGSMAGVTGYMIWRYAVHGGKR